jgi:hypothetical protein
MSLAVQWPVPGVPPVPPSSLRVTVSPLTVKEMSPPEASIVARAVVPVSTAFLAGWLTVPSLVRSIS